VARGWSTRGILNYLQYSSGKHLSISLLELKLQGSILFHTAFICLLFREGTGEAAPAIIIDEALHFTESGY
jgi:hypothetical protein